MRIVVSSTMAVGELKVLEESVHKWQQVNSLLYPVIPRAIRLSVRHRLQICYCGQTDWYPDQNFGRSGLNGALHSRPQARNRGYQSLSTVPPSLLFQLINRAPTVYSPKTVLRSSQDGKGPRALIEGPGVVNETDDTVVVFDEEVEDRHVVQETLKMFEWPAICAQVAQFASTPMGISIAGEANLTIGANKLQSEALLKQTAATCALPGPLYFSGIENLQGLIMEAVSGNVCEIKELCIVKNTLTGIQSVYDQLCGPKHPQSSEASAFTKAESLSSLQALMSDCDLCSDLVDEIDNCLDCTLSMVLDRASPALATTRFSRQENMKSLEALLKDTATWLVQQGGIDSVIVTRRRTRLCIAVRSSHKSLLPGGVTLDVSNTGTTSFIEPEPAVILNNEEMRLAALEKTEEIAVLGRLTFKLVDKAHLVMDLLGRITMVDLACARASHARWLGSVCPSFYEKLEYSSTPEVGEPPLSPYVGAATERCTDDGANDHLMVEISGMRHPLLLGAVLPTLPLSQRYGTVKSLVSPRSSPTPKVVNNSVESESAKLPVAIDIKVLSKVRVVTISGPNTGGKTATLKTFGVAAIMARAGLFLPAAGQPTLPWFDMVLADIGDDQSLQRSLSTFSGHIQRLCAILEVSTGQSFILLDEIGGGTDPSEGAALATAVLQHLASKVWLTIATTHSAELKSLKDQDPRFENASVEFDVKTLKPTYRVLWGIAGQSNALDIADSLGFDTKVLTRARELVGKLLPSELGVRTTELLVPLMKQHNELLERSRRASHVLSKAQKLHHELKAAADNLPKREVALRRFEEQTVQSDITNAKLRMEQLLDSFLEAMQQHGDNVPSMREAQTQIASIVEEFSAKKGSTAIPDLFPGVPREKDLEVNEDKTSGAKSLTVGEKVIVRRLGKSPVTIIELPQKDSDYLTVQLGNLKMQVRSKEVVKSSGSGSGSAPARIEKIPYKISKRTRSQPDEMSTSEPKYEAAVQTSKNTLDLRGMRVDDAVRELNIKLASKSPLSVLFVIHGIGTGAVKEAIWQTLRKHPYVAKFEEESITNTGCTIVYIQ